MRYDYACPRCGPFEAWARVADRHATRCPGCGALGTLQISTPTVLPDTVPAYEDRGLGARIESRSQRRRLMRDRSLEEVGGTQRHGARGTIVSLPGRATTQARPSGAYARE